MAGQRDPGSTSRAALPARRETDAFSSAKPEGNNIGWLMGINLKMDTSNTLVSSRSEFFAALEPVVLGLTFIIDILGPETRRGSKYREICTSA